MRTTSKKPTKRTNLLRWIGLGGVLTLLFILLRGGTKSPNRGAEPKEIAKFILSQLRARNLKPIHIKIILGQIWHETGGYKSKLAQQYNNLFGITNHPTGTGEMSESGFMNYPNFENNLEDYFAIINHYQNQSQQQVPDTFIGYATWLKENGYYTDTVNNYVNGMISGWQQTAKLLNIEAL